MNLLTKKEKNELGDKAERPVVIQLYQEGIQHWAGPVNRFLNLTGNMLQHQLSAIVNDEFTEYRQTELLGKITSTITSFCDQEMQEVRLLAQQALLNEQTQQATLNVEGLRIAQDKCRAALEDRNLEHLALQFLGETETQTSDKTGNEREKHVEKAMKDPKVVKDLSSREIQVMAEVQAYYQMAANRFVDFIFLTVRRHFFSSQVAKSLASKVEQVLGLTEPDGKFIYTSLFPPDDIHVFVPGVHRASVSDRLELT